MMARAAASGPVNAVAASSQWIRWYAPETGTSRKPNMGSTPHE